MLTKFVTWVDKLHIEYFDYGVEFCEPIIHCLVSPDKV